jgi:hypothetical protein
VEHLETIPKITIGLKQELLIMNLAAINKRFKSILANKKLWRLATLFLGFLATIFFIYVITIIFLGLQLKGLGPG